MATTVDVEINGVIIEGLAVAGGYVPNAGDTVPIDIVNGDAMVLPPRDGPIGAVIGDAESDESQAGSLASGPYVMVSLPFSVQAPAGSAPRPVLIVFGFIGTVAASAAGFFWVTIDGGDILSATGATPSVIPHRRWHTQGDSGTFPYTWSVITLIPPGEHTIELNLSNDGGASAAVAWTFPRVDAFQVG